jgi:hypothetical protein
MTFPDFLTETLDADATIAIETDGTFLLVKEKGEAPALCSGTITEDFAFPAAPANGDYHLDISCVPFAPYKRVAGAWVSTQFVKLGEVTRASGTIADPTSYALNGKSVVVTTIAIASSYLVTHGLGTNARLINLEAMHNNITGATDQTAFPDGTDGIPVDTIRVSGAGLRGTQISTLTSKTAVVETSPQYVCMTIDNSNVLGNNFTGSDLRIRFDRGF